MKKAFIILTLVLAACGGSDAADPPADDPTATAADTTVAASTTAAPETDESQPPTTEASNPSSGSAAIVLTIGDETWQFDRAFCAFIGATPGDDGSEWNVTNLGSDAQVYVADDEFGVLVSYADISNGGNPDFNWEAELDGLSMTVDGNDIAVSGNFTDSVSGTGPVAGTLTATCNDWAEG